jgi:predicted ATPase
VGQFQLKDKNIHAGRRSRSSLIGIACDEINSAGPEATKDEDQRRKFAEWNLSAGQDISLQSDFASALYYFSQGIEFLGKDCWVLDPKLCLELHTGAVFASFALGEEHDVVARYAQYVIDHASFEDAIEVRQVILRSLTHSGKHEECTSKGLEILRRLDFEIASNPTPESVMTAMSSTDGIASKFSMEQIIALCEKSVDDAEKRVVKSLDATMASCILSSSPFLPLAACGMIQYSFQHGICPESTTAFAMFAMLKIFLAQDYEGARYWADAVLEMENKHRSINNSGVKLLTQATLALVRNYSKH